MIRQIARLPKNIFRRQHSLAVDLDKHCALIEQAERAGDYFVAIALPVDAGAGAIYTQRISWTPEASAMTRQIAAILRRFPFIMRLPYQIFSRAQARYTLGVAAVVFDQRGRVLIVEHAYHPRLPWGLPGGWVDGDEDPASGILRELREELQLEAQVLAIVHVSRTSKTHVDLAYLCQPTSAVGKLSHELLRYEWVEADSLPHLKTFHQRAISAAQAQRQRSGAWAPA